MQFHITFIWYVKIGNPEWKRNKQKKYNDDVGDDVQLYVYILVIVVDYGSFVKYIFAYRQVLFAVKIVLFILQYNIFLHNIKAEWLSEHTCFVMIFNYLYRKTVFDAVDCRSGMWW